MWINKYIDSQALDKFYIEGAFYVISMVRESCAPLVLFALLTRGKKIQYQSAILDCLEKSKAIDFNCVILVTTIDMLWIHHETENEWVEQQSID